MPGLDPRAHSLENSKTALARSSVFVVEQAPQNGYCQHLCPSGESRWPYVFSRRLLQDQQVGLIQTTFKLLSWLWVPECVKVCTGALRVESLFPTASGSPMLKSHWLSKPEIPGAHIPGAGALDWGARCGAQTPCSLGRTSAILIILPFVGHLPQDGGPDISLPLLPISFWLLLYIFTCEIFFSASLQVTVINSFSVKSCNVGVPMGDELRVFLPAILATPV